jgi:iron(III) transport system substrate-binding protein
MHKNASVPCLTAIVLLAALTPAPWLSVQAQEKVVNVYSARHYNKDTQLYRDFTRQTGIKVNLIEGKDDELLERIKAEGRNSPADVLITVDAGRLWRAEQGGLLQPVNSQKLRQAIPATYRDPDNQWFGLARRARGIVYNKARVKPSQLSSYADLANPRWKGKICTRSADNIYNQSMVAATLAKSGEPKTGAWLKGIVNNQARPPRGNDTTQIQDVAAGVCDIALVNHYYLARMIDSKNPKDREIASKVGFFFPKPTHVNISGAAVARYAPNRANAIAFIEYLASPQGQKHFAEGTYEYPIASSVSPDQATRSFGNFQADSVNVANFGRFNPKAVQLMDRAGWK